MSESTATSIEPPAADGAVPAGEQPSAPPPPESPPAPAPVLEDTAAPQTAEGREGPATEPVEAPVGPGRRGRVLRAVGRWTAAVAVFGLLGAGVAYGLTEAERTDLPGLTTEPDGRWAYPELKLPALPEGSPRPFAEGNEAEVHHVDVRDLLLPAPEGARPDKVLPGVDGSWVSTEEFTQAYVEEDRDDLRQVLEDTAVRHIAARGWRMPDGTRTSVYLLQFNSAAYPGDFISAVGGGVVPDLSLTDAEYGTLDDGWPQDTDVPNIERYTFDESKPRGETHVRQAYLVAGDTVAVVVQARKGEAHAVPFQQTVILQSQLLG